MSESDLKGNSLFLVGVGDDGVPVVSVGLAAAAWEYCKDGKTHTFDLTQVGIPVRIMVFGGDTKESIKAQITQQAKEWGLKIADYTGHDFGIKDKKLH